VQAGALSASEDGLGGQVAGRFPQFWALGRSVASESTTIEVLTLGAIVVGMSPLDAVDATALSAVCERYGIAELAIFGSVAKGDAGPESDVDVLYVLRDGVHLGWAINDLADDLEEVLGRPVDLVSKRALHRQLKDAVLAEARVVYAA
jgi:predicted nucleotidyltransferase